VLVAQKQLHATQTNLQILRDEMAARSPKPRQDAVSLKKTVAERVSAAFHDLELRTVQRRGQPQHPR
jgi:hypothetical protein